MCVHSPSVQTEACENITFPQLLLRTVKMGEHQYRRFGLLVTSTLRFKGIIDPSLEASSHARNVKYVGITRGDNSYLSLRLNGLRCRSFPRKNDVDTYLQQPRFLCLALYLGLCNAVYLKQSCCDLQLNSVHPSRIHYNIIYFCNRFFICFGHLSSIYY